MLDGQSFEETAKTNNLMIFEFNKINAKKENETKNKIKKLIHWTEGKPPLLQIFVWTMTICVVAVILVLMWLLGQAFGEVIMELWGDQALNLDE